MPALLLAAVWLAAFLVSLDYTAVNVALPTLADQLAVGTSAISWIALAYMLVMVALTLLTAPAINRLGYGRALTAGLAVFATASLASALASSLWLLIAMRALQGVGASVMFVIGPALIRTSFPKEQQGRAFAIFSTGPTAGLCAGPAVGGQLTAMFGWESIFVFSLTAALLAILLLRLAGREAVDPPTDKRPARPMPSPLNAALAFAGLLMLLLALNQGQEWGWRSPAILLLFLAAIVAAAALVLMEHGARTPLVDRHVLAPQDFLTSAIVFFPLLVVFGGSVFIVPFYFEWLRKADTDIVGRILMVQPIATIAVSTLAGFFLAGTSRRLLCLAGVVLMAAGAAVLATAGRGAPVTVPLSALGLMGAGAGLYYPTLIQLGMANVPGDLAASASSLQATVRVLAQLMGVVLFETTFSQLFPTALHVDLAAAAEGETLVTMQSAFHAVFACAAVIALVALVPAMMLGRPPGSADRARRLHEAGGKA